MAEARLQVEEYQSEMVACLAASGVIGIRAIGGGVIAGYPAYAGPEVSELVDQAMDDCSEKIDLPAIWRHRPDPDGYQRMIELRECIVFHGFELPAPPSFEVWTEQPWFPYLELADVPPADLRELVDACPPSGPSFAIVTDDEWRAAGLD